MKNKLDELVEKYETKDFIKNDPILFPHRYLNKEDIEIAAFISALFAYGKRELFIKKLDLLFAMMPKGPYEFVLNYSARQNIFKGFVYRFVKDVDLESLFCGLSRLYKSGSSLEELFSKGTQEVADFFYTNAQSAAGQGFYHLVPNPKKGGAQKRFNMFLRWMIREGPVDLGIWDFIKKDKLLIPLDVHVGNVSRALSLLQRNSNDFKAVLELTNELLKFDPHDPVRYDFALFGVGVDKNNILY